MRILPEQEFLSTIYRTSTGKVALWLKKLLWDFGIQTGAITSDNQGAIKLLKHPIASVRSKHIDVIHHFARERVFPQEVVFEYCSTSSMVADCFIKVLLPGKFGLCCASVDVMCEQLCCHP